MDIFTGSGVCSGAPVIAYHLQVVAYLASIVIGIVRLARRLSTERSPASLASAGALSYARNVPHRGTVRTRPSAARARSTRVTVAWETW